MSDTPIDTKPGDSKPKPRRWRRRIMITVVTLFGLAVVLRILLHLTLPAVLNRIAAMYDVNISYERQELTLFGGDAGLWFVKVTPKTGGEPILAAEYVRGNISVLQLLRGRLVVWRVEADGADLLIERTEDGRIPILEAVLSNAPATEPASHPSDVPAGPIDLTSPLRVDALRLNRIRATIRDRAVNPPFAADVQMNLRLSDLGSWDRATRFEVEVWSDPLLDSLRVEGQGSSHGRKLDAKMSISMRGLHLRPLAAYMAPLGLKPAAQNISAQARATFITDAAEGSSDAIAAALVLTELSATADEAPAAVLDKLELRADSIDTTAARFASLLIDGVRLNASRTHDGTMRLAGVDLVAPSGGLASAETPSPPAPVPSPTTLPAPYYMSLADFRLQNVSLNFRDDAVSPPANLVFVVDAITSKNVPLDASDPQATLALAGKMSSPGIVPNVELTGVLRPYASLKTLNLSVAGSGLKPDALTPYLKSLGVESLYRTGQFAATINASVEASDGKPWRASARISDIQLRDSEELLTMGQITIDSLGVDPSTGRWRIAGIDIAGPSLTVRHGPGSAVSALGLRFDPDSPVLQQSATIVAEPSSATPATQPPTGDALTLPRVQLDRFAWKAGRIYFEDLAFDEPKTFDLSDAGVELTNLVIDLESTDTTGQTGRFHAHMASPGLAENVSVEGTIMSGASALALDARLTGRGLSPAALAAYLQPLGIEPALSDGTLAAGMKVKIERVEGGSRASLLLENVRYGTTDEELIAVDGVLVSDATLGVGVVDVKFIGVDRPRARLGRDPDGAFTAAGLRIHPPATAPHTNAASQAEAPAHSSVSSPTTAALSLGALQINDAVIEWTDNAMKEPVHTTLRSTVQVDRLVLGKSGAPPADFTVIASADGALDSASVIGTIDASPDAPAVSAQVRANGVRAGPLAAYLPPGVDVSLQDGRFAVAMAASVSKNPQGGNGARLDVKQLDYRDGGQGPPLFALESVVLSASRIDPDAGVYAIDEVLVHGVETHARVAVDGSLHALGIALNSAMSSSPDSAQTATVSDAFTAASSQPSPDVADLVAQGRKTAPLLTLHKLDLNFKRLAIRHDSQSSGELALTNWSVRNASPIALGGDDADAQPPIAVEIAGAVDPIVQSVSIRTHTTPLALEPAAQVDIDVRGIRGSGLTDLLPRLTDQIDGAQLTDGRFQTHVELTGKLDRRGGSAIDLNRGFDLNVLVNNVAFRNGPDGPLLAGVESIESEGIRVEPSAGNVHVKTLQITKPMGYAMRDAEGIHVLGWIVKLPTVDASSPTTATVGVVEASAHQPSAASEPSLSSPAGEIRIDRLLVSGVDLTLEDRAVTPMMIVPLNGLDVEVRDLTNRALTENRPIRFNAIVNAGKVELPKHAVGAGIAGVVGDVGVLLGGRQIETATQSEQRDLFSQIAASGRVSLYPAPSGYAKASISGLELAGFSGTASQAGVTLNGGVFDGDFDLRSRDDGTIDAKMKLVMTDLAVSEPENGPIAKHLALPAPLDAVIGVLEDADGSITLPVSVQVKQGELKEIGPAASGAVSSVIVTAFASAPMKAAGGVTGLIGLPGQEKDAQGPPPVVIEFPSGYTGLTPQAQTEIDRLIELHRGDPSLQFTLRHELSAEDVERSQVRANPSAEEMLALARQLRAEKSTLIAARQSLAGKARTELATLPAGKSNPTLEQLRELDRQIALTEDALDECYEMHRPGADRQAPRRTRAAALAIARERLMRVQSSLLSLDRPSDAAEASERVRIINPQFAAPFPAGVGRVTVTIIPTQARKAGMLGFVKLPGLGK